MPVLRPLQCSLPVSVLPPLTGGMILPVPKLPSPRSCGQAVQAAFWADASAHALRPHLGLGNGAAGSVLEAMLATLGTS